MASSARVKPGEKGAITVSVDTTARSGRLYKAVEVFSNDPARPKLTLTLTAIVEGSTRPH